MKGFNFSARNNLDRVATKSALSPGLWLVAATYGAAVPTSIFSPGWPAVVCWSLAVFITAGTFFIFVFHSVKNPTLLRSEEYSLKYQALAMYGDGSKSPSEIAGILSSPAISPLEYIEGVERG